MTGQFLRYFSVCVLSFGALQAFGVEFDSTQYDIYYGDVDQDNLDDFYFHPKERLVLLHGDIVTPIVLPKAAGFTVTSVEFPNLSQVQLLELTESDIATKNLVLATEGSDYFYGDFNGDGVNDVITRGVTNDSPAYEISGSALSGTPNIARVYDSSDAPEGYNLSNRNIVLSVVDANGDGIDDLVSYSGSVATHGYLSNGTPLIFSSGIDFKLATTTQAIGAVAGSHEVGSDGSANYGITIAASEGIAGMRPNMSLNYSSSAGGGYAGMGWGLGGISNIMRCGTDFEVGGELDEVDFDGNDYFCLDGQPLVAITGQYGAHETEYRTRAESFSKIVSYGQSGDCVRNGVNVPGPEKFRVWSSSGQIYEYGFTDDSRQEGQGCSDVIKWAINKEEDRYANSVNYHYVENAGDHYISSIDYNAGSSQITFDYIDREDVHIVYFAGVETQQTKLLNKISSFDGGALLRDYHLEYELVGSSSVSRLKSLIECSSTECLPATEFTWSDGSTASTLDYNQRISSTLCQNDSLDFGKCNNEDNAPYIHYADINGDGLDDVCYRGDYGIQCRLGTADGFTGEHISTNICSTGSTLYGGCNGANNYGTIALIDVDADGLADLVFRSDEGVRVMRSTGTGFTDFIVSDICANESTLNGVCNGPNHYYSLRYPDLNGDGLPDICYRGDEGINCFLGTGTGFDGTHISTNICANGSNGNDACNSDNNYETIRYVDVNGDGMVDLVIRTDSGVRAWRFTGDDFVPHISSSICANDPNGECNSVNNYYFVQYPDINGDGIADVCYRGDTGIRCHIGTGYSWDGGEIITGICANDSTPYGECDSQDNYRTIKYIDLNQDGRADMLFRSDEGIWAFKSTGTGFELLFSKPGVCAHESSDYGACNSENNYDTMGAIDFNGDGLPDLVYRGDEGIQLWPLNVDQQNLMTKVVNGFGVETKFNYKLMTDNSVYTKGTENLSYPEKHFIHPGKVVSSVQRSDGLGAYNSLSYTYKGMRAHLKGLGILGFSEMTVTNDDTGIATKTVYSMDYTQRTQGFEEEVTTTAANGTVLLKSNIEYQLATWGSGDSYRYQVQPTKTSKTERDLNGVFLKRSESSILGYDSFGAPVQTKDELFAEGEALPISIITVDFEYSHDAGNNWFLSRVLRSTSTTAVSGRASRKHVSTWEYDALTSRMTIARIRHPDTDAILHETQYGIDENGDTKVDVYGNNLAISISGPDFTSRTSKIEFDTSGRRVISKTNALGFSISTEYYAVNDLSDGAYPNMVKAITGVNGLKAMTHYDSFGRMTGTSAAWESPFQMNSTTEFRACDSNCPMAAVYYIVSKSDAGGESRVYLDQLGRKLRQKSQTFKKLSEASTWVNIDYRYDHRGHAEVSEPYFEGESASLWAVRLYDDLDRVTQITYPDARVDSTEFNGLIVTTHTDILGKNQKNIAENNILGELSKVTDNNDQDLLYSYDAHGNLLSTTDPDNNVVQITYDAVGRKTGMIDPDKGTWAYTYNGIAQLISQTNARGETTCNVYDILGRKTKRIDNYQGSVSVSIGQTSQATDDCAGDDINPEVATWVYDSATGAALGKPHRVIGKDGYQNEIVYDIYGRVIENITSINGESYSTSLSYDGLSRPEFTTYPGVSNRLQLKNTYNSLGMLTDVRNAADSSLYYQVGELDARGSVVSEMFGNGVETTRTYRADNGRLQTIAAGIGIPGMDAQNLGFTFDALGNLDYRQDFKNGFREDFVYDSNNRLLTNTADFGNGDIRTTQVTYDALGNILTKSGVGAYKYGSDCSNGYGPHAVCEITGSKNAIYSYDPNGNMTSGDGRTIEYTFFDKPDRIVKGNNITEISYGPSRSRYFRRDTVDISVTEHTYAGGSYEKVDFKNDGIAIDRTEERHYIGGFAVLTIEGRDAQTAGTSKTRYLHKDHIGSTTAITDENGAVVEEFSFDPWGKRRATSLDQLEFLHGPWSGLSEDQKNNLTTDPSELASYITNKGFTGHEQMDAVGLIHMNGRVYDAELGRFIQADPVLQAPTDLQSYNRFSYVRNNPLSLVDPSGYSWLSKQYKRFKRRASRRWQQSLKYSQAYRLSKKIDNEVNRATMRAHDWARGEIKFLNNLDNYVSTHDWAAAVVIIVVAVYSKNPKAVVAVSVAMAKHRAYLAGGSADDVRRAGNTAFVTSVISSVAGEFINGWVSSTLAGAIPQAAASTASQIALGYAMQGAANKGHFGSFKDYMKGWAASAAFSWVVGKVIGGGGGGGPAFCDGTASSTPNPINIFTGEKYLTMKDYQASGASLLKFERYYSSYAKDKTSLGYGWRSNFDNRLLFNSKNPENISQVKAVRSQGDSISFNLSDKKEWQTTESYESLKRNSSGWALTLTNNRIEYYDLGGRLVRIQDLGGYEQVLHYGESGGQFGQLISVTDSFNQKLHFEYNDQGLLSALITAGDSITRYEYDRFNSLEKVISSQESTAGVVQQTYKQYLHEDSRFVHSITGIVNHTGERIHTMAYDERGRAVLSELAGHAERAEIVFHNDRRSTVTNALGKTTTYTFNDANKPLKVEGHASASCIASNKGYEYDNMGLLLSKTGWNGTQTRYEYNERGLETLRIEAVGTDDERTIRTKWHKDLRLPVVITEPLKIEKFKYNRQGLLVSRTEIDTQSPRKMWQRLSGNYKKRTWVYEYNHQNLLALIDGPRNDVNDITQFNYDVVGNRTSVENALGHRVETTAFNQRGLPLIVKDVNGIETHLTYNARGWLVGKEVVGPEGDELTRYAYTGVSDYSGEGMIKSVTLPNGSVMQYEYDNARRLISEINGLGERIDYALDLEGNRLASVTYSADGELVHTQRQVFDELSRVLQSIGADGATMSYHYDKAGRRIGVTDALGNKTAYAYDALNRLVATTNTSGVIEQNYNRQSQITSVRDQRGLVTEYRYNGFGDKIAQISPDTGTTTFAYNKSGRVVKKVDARGEVTLYKNDVLGRISDILYPAANDENIHYVYDAYVNESVIRDNYLIGRIAEIHDASGETVYHYNHRGQVVAQDYRIGEHSYQIAYNYDRFGALTQMVYPGGRVVSYQYDDNARLAQVDTIYGGSTQLLAENFSHSVFGPLRGLSYGNGSELTIRRDQGYRITDIQVISQAANDVLYDVGFVYDLASNIEAINDGVLPSSSQRFEYDDSYRLVQAKGQYGEINYAYDGVGNRLSRERINVQALDGLGSRILESYEYAQDSNRLLSVVSVGSEGLSNSRDLVYDAVGNIVLDHKTDNVKVLQYSARNRLTKVEIGDDGVEAHYVYNAKGQRVSKVVSGVVTHFHYDIANRLVAETSIGAVTENNSREFVYAAGQRIAMVDYSQAENEQVLFVVNDHLGTPQMLLSMAEEVVWQMNASPFGEVALADSGVKQPLRFPGQYGDDETGYSYNYFRDYDPSLGRYIQSDPIGLAGGVNTFGYVLGNPIMYFDSKGLDRRIETTDSKVLGHQRLSIDNWEMNEAWRIPMDSSHRLIQDGVVEFSFGLQPGESVFGGKGSVYFDTGNLDEVLSTKTTTPKQDLELINKLNKRINKDETYNIITNSCRTFASENF